VLDTLAKTGAITPSTAKSLGELPLEIAPYRSSSSNPYPAYVDYLHRQIRQYFTEDVLRTDGLNLYTSLDPGIQDQAQSALTNTLGELEKQHGIDSGSLQGAVVVVDIRSGDILAMIGNRQSGYSGFNRAIDANRPIGSLVKPLVYLTALERPREFSLATVVQDEPITLHPKGGEEWSPRNYDKTYRGSTNVLDALTRSYNVPTVRVGLDVGVDNVVRTIGRLGVNRKINAYPSLLLGANEHSPIEVAQLYQSIANHGVQTPVRSISSITDRNDKVIARFSKDEKRVIDEKAAYLIDYGLKQVVRSGTAARLGQWFSPELQLAGKTGTTDDYRDSWFAGYSGNILSVVWVGRDDNKPFGLTGSSGAMMVWHKVMSSLSLAPARFEQPADVVFVDVDPESGLLYGGGCAERRSIPVNSSYTIRQKAPCSGFVGRVQSWFNLDVVAPPANSGDSSRDRNGPRVIDRSIERNR
jgi:penicillin-binding protein 1B